jgi:hypothetical protein
MLDLSHPQTEHIFAAGRLEDSVRIAARRIIAAPAAERRALLAQFEGIFDKMRTLNLEHFAGSRFISEGIDDLQQALRRLTETDQAHFDIIMPALTRLSSAEGFQTEFI